MFCFVCLRPVSCVPQVYGGVHVTHPFSVCVVCFVLFVFVLCLVCPMLSVSLDYPSLIAPSVFFNVYLIIMENELAHSILHN